MANEQNLIPFNERSPRELKEISRKGQKASTKAKREKKTMKEMLKLCLEMKNDDGQSYQELATLGLIKGAVNGNSNNYRTILETLGELEALKVDIQAQQLTKVEELLTKLDEEAKK